MSTVDIRVFENPLPGIEPRIVTVEVGTKLADAVVERAPFVCLIDGVPMKRDYWRQREVYEGDQIELHCVHLGGGGSRSILGAIAMIALAYFAPMMVASWGPAFANAAGQLTALGRLVARGIVLIGNALISAVLTPSSSSNQPDKGSSVYNVDTQGNQAKIFSPIPVQYGRVKAFPDYAAQPYVRYHTGDEEWVQIQLKGGYANDPGGSITVTGNDTPTRGDIIPVSYAPAGTKIYSRNVAQTYWRASPDGDQFYYALFCLGQGEYEVESIMIADAPIESFEDVLVSRILEPGQKPSYVDPCTVSSEAVAGQSLDKGEYVGPFPVCGPTRRTSMISFDIVFPQGLCRIDDKGKARGRSVQIVADIAPYSDDNVQTGPWTNVFQHNIDASSLTPQRRTFDIGVQSGRYIIRIRRGDVRDKEDSRDMSSAQWAALRAKLDDPAPLCPTATHYELVMRASEQLSSLSQRKISIIATRKVRNFDGELVPSRSPLLALLDKWRDNVYGDGLPADRIDMDTLRILDALATRRRDQFDFRFESRVTSEEADQVIAKVLRSVVLQRNGVKTIVRDGLVDLPLTAFNETNITENSASIEYVQVTEETADGVIAEYFDKNSWDWEEVECPAPGFTYTSSTHPGYDPSLPRMENPARIRLEGITERHHAQREGTYFAYTNALRRRFVSWKTEMQGILVHYGAPVMFASTLYNSESGGEVIDYRESDGAIRLSSDVSSGNSRLVFMNANGSMSNPFSFSSLGDGWVRLHGDSPMVNWGDYASERTRYVVLVGEMNRHLVKIISLEPRGMSNTGAPEYELRGVVDVPEVHTADEQFLPGPDNPTPGPDVPVVILNGQLNSYTDKATWPDSGCAASLLFYPDGAVYSLFYEIGVGARWVNIRSWTKYLQNAGDSFEIAIAVSRSGFDKDVLDAMSRYIWWKGSAKPESNMILQGTQMSVYRDSAETDGSTWELGKKAKGGETDPTRLPIMSDWISMSSTVTLESFWNGFPPTSSGRAMELKTLNGYIGIRDKGTKTLQAAVPFEMGFFEYAS